MEFVHLSIPDVILVKPRTFSDARGFFMETWEKKVFESEGINLEFVQDNHSHSTKNVLRGMHYQIQHPQGKLIRAITGSIFDAVIDLRKESPTFGKWVGAILNEENHYMLWIPPGFAHGFCVLSESTDFVYKETDYYTPEFERSIIWNDPEVGIVWPDSLESPILSPKDLNGKFLRDAEIFY